MRVLFAVALFACGAVTTGTARAADLPVERGFNGYSYFYLGSQRAGQVVSYEFEPGVPVRAYWLPPWQNRHYFPFGVDRPQFRHKISSAKPKPAESYYRYWSTSFIQEQPRAVGPAYDRAPDVEPAPRNQE